MFIWSRLASLKWRDAWEERLLGGGQTNAVITAIPGRPTIRLEVYCNTERDACDIRRQFGGSVRRAAHRDLAAAAPVPAKPLRIRGRLVVINTPDLDEARECRAAFPDLPVLQIPAAMAFGTGDHATTATCLRLLVDAARGLARSGRGDWSMADLGSGTGILALAARCLGAATAVGLDHDPQATRVARRNAKLNHVTRVAFGTADLLGWRPPQRFDIVAANVFAGILVKAMPVLKRALAPHGHLILSGILNAQADEVVAAGLRHGLVFPNVRKAGKWTTLGGHHADRPPSGQRGLAARHRPIKV